MMKKAVLISAVLAAAGLLAAGEDPSLLFRADFDTYSVWADYAKGAKNSDSRQSPGFQSPDLQLRMHKGIPGSKNSVCLTNAESLCYANYRNFDPQQGTVSFWVSPKNWTPSKRKFEVFFTGSNPGGFKLVIAKWIDGELRFSIHMNNQDVGVIRVPMPDSDWKADSWHKLDAVWDQTEMRFYVDGVLAKTADIYSVFNPLKFKTPRHFPKMADGANIRINDARGYAYDKNDSTAYDNIRIYNRKLSAAEIQEDYLKVFPPANQKAEIPLAPVPQTETGSVSVDGRLDAAEWAGATRLPLMNVCNSVNAGKLYTGNAVLLKHDHENLYIAAELEGEPKAIGAARDDDAIWRNDDALELHFAKDGVRRQLVINASGMVWDATGTAGQTHIPNGNTAWNPAVKTAAAAGQNRWTLEAAIPLHELGLSGAGDSFRANFYKNYQDKGRFGMSWAVQPKEYFSDEYFGELRLGGDQTFYSIVNYGDYSRGHWSVELKGESRLSGAGSLSSLGTVMKTSGNLVNGKAWNAELSGGTWNGTVNIFQSGEKIGRLAVRFHYDANLQMTVRGDYPRKQIRFNLSFGGLYKTLAALAAEKQIRGTILLKTPEGETIRTADFIPSQPEMTVSLPLEPELVSGKYEAVVQLNGKELSREHSVKFTIPDLTPYQERLMADHSVPTPWVPVKDSGSNVYTVLNREYRFGQTPFPVQILADGKAQLSSAPELFVRTGKGTEKIHWQDFTRRELHEDQAVFTGKGISESLEIRWKGELFFDGTWKVELDVSPRNGKVRLDSLMLNYAVPAENVKAVLTPFYAPWQGKKLRYRYSRTLLDFLIWTTGWRHGFAWMPLDSANWHNARGESQITLTPEQNSVRAEIRYISKPVELNKTARYSMLMMATPAKNVEPELRNFHLGHHTGWGRPYAGENAKCNGHMNDANGYTQAYTTQPWASLKPWKPEKFRAYLDELAKDGIGYMPYSQPGFISRLEPEYDFFIDDWRLIPGIVGGTAVDYDNGSRYDSISTCQDAGSTDYHMTLLKKCLDDYPDLIGVYYDLCHVVQCSNLRHGHGGVDAFGQEYTTSNVMSLRNFLLRTYKLLHQRGKYQKIHAHHRFVPFAHTFTDFAITGEQYNGKILQDVEHFFTEKIPAGAYRTLYNPQVTGMKMLFNSHLEIQPMFRPGGEWDSVYVRTPRLTLKFATPMLLHDIGVVGYYSNREVIGRCFTVSNEVALGKAEFCGYWENTAVKSASPKVYVSLYRWTEPSPHSRLLVIGNLGRTAQPAALKINWNELGIEPGHAEFMDVWNKQKLNGLDSLEIPGEGFRLIGIKIKTSKGF